MSPQIAIAPALDTPGTLDDPERDLPVRLINFGLFGAAVETSTRVLPGARGRLVCATRDQALDLPALVVRSMLRLTPTGAPYYEIGLRFADVLGDRGQQVLGFLVETGTAGTADRLGERFAIESGSLARFVLDPDN